jgi:selenocysteine lyase/cysteine desulfurase
MSQGRARESAEEIFVRDRKGEISPEQKTQIRNHARKLAAEMVNLKDPTGVVLCDNTSEAIGLGYWLAGLEDGSEQNVVSTNAENVSAWFAFQMHQDHGNKSGKHGYTTFPTFGARQAVFDGGVIYEIREDGSKVQEFEPVATGIQVKKLEVLQSEKENIFEQLENLIDSNTKLLFISHVLRDNGREMPVREICERARVIKAQKNPDDPEICIFVDGAQALGNINKIDFNEIGCDLYCANPHKTLGSEVVGLLFFDPKNPRVGKNLGRFANLDYTQQVLRRGMLHPDVVSQITPGKNEISNVPDEINIADTWGFIVANKILKEKYALHGNDFSKIITQREKLKQKLLGLTPGLNSRLEKIGNIRLEPQTTDSPTSFILGFKLGGLNGDNLVIKAENLTGYRISKLNTLAQRLWQKGVFISLINRNSNDPRQHIFRVAFGLENTEEEIETFIQKLEEAIKEVSEFEKQLAG